MGIIAERRTVAELMPHHELYRAYANCQIVRDSYWARGFADVYAIAIDGRVAGHGAVANRYDEGSVIEFFALPQERRHAVSMFAELLVASKASRITAQTNIPLMLMMLAEFATAIKAENVLFADAETTRFPCPHGAFFRRLRREGELAVFEHHHEPRGEWVIEAEGKIVATGGFLTHYNPPYADLYMEVEESHRGRGYGAYLIQELKRVCYESGRRPAARCDPSNVASRKTLEKAGLLACGHMLIGNVKAHAGP